MKKLLIILFFSLFMLRCSNINSLPSDDNLKNYYYYIDKKIQIEMNKDTRIKYKKKLSSKEAENNPEIWKKVDETVKENGYINVYNSYDQHLSESYQLNSEGEVEGVVKFFDENEILRKIGYYENNELNGALKEYNEKGILIEETQYYNGKINGIRKKYFSDGKLSEECFYRNNKLEGKYIIYHRNGKVSKIKNYKNGKLDGEYIVYDENEKIKEIRNFSRGKEILPEGVTFRKTYEISFDKDGKEIWKEVEP